MNYPKPNENGKYDEKYTQVKPPCAIWAALAGHRIRKPGEWFLLVDGEFQINARPVMRLTGNPEEDYAELCAVFGAKQISKHSAIIAIEFDLHIGIDINSQATHISMWTNYNIAGHGTPPELPLMQQRVNCVQDELDRLQEAQQ